MTAALASAGVQYGTITVGSGSATGTASISAMGAGGFLLMDGLNASQAGASEAQSSCTLSISGTTITATRQTGGANTVTVPFVAVDGDTTNLIKSVQFGSVSFVGGSSTGNATISSVTTGNTAVAHLGMFSTQTSVSLNLGWPIWAVASATTISMTTNTSGGVLTGQFCAIEFQSSALVSLQYVADTAAPSANTRAHTITAVTLANTLSIYAGQWSSSTTPSSQQQYGQLTNTTTLTIGTNSTGFVSISFATFIVNLASALVETGAQRGLITQTAAASATAAISSVNTAHAILTYNGNQTNAANWNGIVSSLSLTSSILVTANSGTTTTNSTSYEVIALNSAAAAAAFVNFMAVFDDRVKPPKPNAQNSFVVQEIQPSAIAQNNYFAFYKPEVVAPPPRAQHSFVAQEIQPNAIAQNKFYPVYDAQVKANPPRAQYTVQFDEKVLPQPISQNNYFAFYAAELKPPPNAAQYTFVAQEIQPNAIDQNKWYPIYDPQVKGAPPRYSYFAQLLPTPTTPVTVLNFFPAYDATVKPFAARRQFSDLVQPTPASIGQNNFYPAYAAEVKPGPKAAQFSCLAQLLPPTVTINRYYPLYPAEVKAGPSASQFSGLAYQLPAPVALNNFYPAYPAEVKAPPSNNPIFVTPPIPAIPVAFAPNSWYPAYPSEVVKAPANARDHNVLPLPRPIIINNWLPQYPDNVNHAPLAAQFTGSVNPFQLLEPPPPQPDVVTHKPKLGLRRATTRGAEDPRGLVDYQQVDWQDIYKKRRARLEQIASDTFRPKPPGSEDVVAKELLPIDFEQVTHAQKSKYHLELLLLNSSLPFWC